MIKLRLVVLLALVTATLSVCGASVAEEKNCDNLHADSAAQAKYTFYVPYKKVNIKELTCDTSSMIEALKDVYGDDIRIEHTPTAYTVDVVKLNFGKHATQGNKYMARIDAHAEVTVNGKTSRITGEYGFKADISGSNIDSRSLCYGVMLDVAKKVKSITDNPNKPGLDFKGRDDKLHIY